MDFLTFMDKFFEKDWKNTISYNARKSVLTHGCDIILKVKYNHYRIEIEKISNNSFRIDIPYSSESGDNFDRFFGTYDYIKSIVEDIITMEDNIYKLAYGRNKPKFDFLDIDFSESYELLLSGEDN